MRLLKKAQLWLLAGAVWLTTGTALAQLTAPTRQNAEGLLGVDTDGSETGIHELVALFDSGVVIVLGIALAASALYVMIRLLMKGRRATN